MSLCIGAYILKHGSKGLLVFFFTLIFITPGFAQEAPPRPIVIYVNPSLGLNFGTFTMGNSGGSVIIYPNGTRSSTGDIIQLSSGTPFSPAIFEVEANIGTVVSILNGPNVLLNGSNGGTLLLQIGASSTGSPFVTNVAPPGRTQVRIGGTIIVGSALTNPGGSYSGTFMVTFIQE
ncbi:MAG: DUF4402 domain-containing protein [Bacteroidetes bacterium]|nr:DUF4402 domain-containing protein [Bacteroidota bacterium]